MKIFLLSLFFFIGSVQLLAQDQLSKFTKEYYRVNPFQGTFSSFVKALSGDPELLNKTLVQKTDTSNYFLKGDYKVFNPFGLNANKVEMIFAEHQVDVTAKSRQEEYTIYTYQILAYFDDNKLNRDLILKDYNKLKKKLKRELQSEVIGLKGVQNITDGEITNFFYSTSIVYPVTISWQTLSKSGKLALTIITKLFVGNNYAMPVGGGLNRQFSQKILQEKQTIQIQKLATK